MPTSSAELDPLGRSIVAALQINCRASWRAIAAALGEPERTVARRGAELLAQQVVKVRALPNPRRLRGADQYVFRGRCLPGSPVVTTRALAARPETLFAYVLTGAADCAADLFCPPDRFSDVVLAELGSVPGLTATTTYPVLRYFRTMHQWRPTTLDPAAAAQLEDDPPSDDPESTDRIELDPAGRSVLQALRLDGRAGYEEIARAAGVSLQTARRRVEQLRLSGACMLRAIFEPAVLGLRTEALLWVRAPYTDIDAIGEELQRAPQVRYAAVIAGDHQLVVDVVVKDRSALYDYLRTAPWTAKAQSIEPTLVVEAFKRSGTPTDTDSTDGLL